MSSLLHDVVHVILDNPHRPQAPIRKHGVGSDVDVDLTAGQVVLHVEPTVLGGLLYVASLHEAILQQLGEAVMVQTSHALPAILVDTVRVVYHLGEDFKGL
jgi:hypothetical protein